jgi:hypothetical protein
MLEAINGSLAFLLAGIAAVQLASPYDVIAPLIVGAIIVFNGRLLGKNATDSVNELNSSIQALVASEQVLKSGATAAVARQAEEAKEAIRPSPPVVTKGT